MHNSKQNLVIGAVGAVIVIGASFGAGVLIGYEKSPAIDHIIGVSNMETGKGDNVDFREFWEAWKVIDDKFMPAPIMASSSEKAFDKVGTTTKKFATNQERTWGAIGGMVKAMGDPYTTYFPPVENKQFSEDLSGEFGGVGMEVGMRKNVITVISPLEGTPAKRAGVMAGDRVVAIDGASTMDMSVEQAVRKIRGQKGTFVKITIIRDGEDKPIDLKIMRDTILAPTIKSTIYDEKGKEINKDTGLRQGGTFVIRLYSFTAQSPQLFQAKLKDFAAAGTDKMIIDLRGNPGGFLEAAVDIASWFLPAGDMVVSERFGKEGTENPHRSKGYNAFTGKLKLAVLIDKGSASASEILAGALKENGKAILVGEKSYGKGSVQELVELTPETSVKVTVARWFTPKGHLISENGLTPDYLVETKKEDIEANRDPVLLKAIELLAK